MTLTLGIAEMVLKLKLTYFIHLEAHWDIFIELLEHGYVTMAIIIIIIIFAFIYRLYKALGGLQQNITIPRLDGHSHTDYSFLSHLNSLGSILWDRMQVGDTTIRQQANDDL